MVLCFLGLLRLTLLVGGLQAYFTAHRLTPAEPVPTPLAAPAGLVPHSPVAGCPAARCAADTPHLLAVGQAMPPAAVRTLPMPREVVEAQASTYTVRILHGHGGESFLQWPNQIVTPGKPSHVGFDIDVTDGWMMTTLLQESEKEEHMKVHLLVTHLTGEETPRIYKGTLECKLGVAHLSVLRESTAKHLLPIRVHVEKCHPGPSAVPPLAMPAPMPGPIVQPIPAMQPLPTVAMAFVPAVHRKTVSLKIENGETKLAFRSSDLRTCASEMTLEFPAGTVHVKAAKSFIAVQGNDFTARANKLEILGD
ncbi:MAG: hypothetical protein SNJ82_06620, partial [Gemmataceae bacterium]